MIISLWVDSEKDEKLIEWLRGKTNRSAFIRFVLYEKMNGISGFSEIGENNKNFNENERNFIENQGKFKGCEDNEIEIEDGFLNCIDRLE